jgi:putative protein kinase ArgK-like GTPase of G3E family
MPCAVIDKSTRFSKESELLFCREEIRLENLPVSELPAQDSLSVIGLCGPPGTGKSTTTLRGAALVSLTEKFRRVSR